MRHDQPRQRDQVVAEMWPNSPGGWVYEWSNLAATYAQAGAHQHAALAYGWAKFPTLADDHKRAALANQLEQYQLAAPDFGVDFRREILALPHQGSTTQVPVHLFTPLAPPSQAPVVILSGGVDSWKMDVHGICVGTAARLGVRVLAFDIPGTGASSVPMTAEGGARSGLAGEVDAAVVLGGPVEEAFTGTEPKQFGMDGIVGNALGFDHLPTPSELNERHANFTLRPLLDQNRNSPMLVINGADDVHVPQHDTLVFEGRRNTTVDLIPNTGHCASSKLPQATATIADWLQQTVTSAAAS